jgi:hypothetical protein
MFRRFEGRVLVAVFVYRVTAPGGELVNYAVRPEQGGPNPNLPPIPIWRDWTNGASAWDAFGPDLISGTVDDARVPVTEPPNCEDYRPLDRRQSWQEPGQWILDQNNNVHRVLSSYCDEAMNERIVELAQPLAAMATLQPFYFVPPANGAENVVTDIWYLPLTAGDGRAEVRLTPVYLTVKEL